MKPSSFLPLAWLIPAGAVFGVSLLAIVPPPLNVLWKLSIPVLEGGHFAAPAATALALVAWFAGARASGLLFAAAALLFISPLARAVPTATRLERGFARMFPDAPESPRPALVARDLFLGIRMKPVTPRSLAYADVPGSPTDSLMLDFYPATAIAPGASGSGAPCIVVVHGGSWDSGDRTQLAALNGFLAGAGYAVAAVDYRLAPEHVFPAPVEDVSRALEFLRGRADELGIDTARMVLMGRSAGGQIALQAAYALKDRGIRSVVAFYAPADMVFGYDLPANPLILDSRKVMDRYLGGPCSERPELCRNSSPLHAAGADAPPTLLLHGHPDALVSFRHSTRLVRRLTTHGVPHFLVDLPWAAHGYDYVFSGPGSQISLRFILRFLAATTRDDPGRPGAASPRHARAVATGH